MPTQNLTAMVTVNRMLYPRSGFESGGWCILACTVKNIIDGEPYADDIVIKGCAYSAGIGQTYRLIGTFVEEDRYGPYYSIVTFSKELNMDDQTQQRGYVESLCTPTIADSLYATLPNPFQALKDKNIEALIMAKGVGPVTAQRLIEKFHAEFSNAKVYAVLGQYGLSSTVISNLLKKFPSPEACIKAVEDNPYLMIEEVDGIGWVRADAIAHAKGIAKDAQERIEAAIVHVLNENSYKGDTWISPNDLLVLTFTLLGFDDYNNKQLRERFREALVALYKREMLWWDETKTIISLMRLRLLEEKIAKELLRIRDATPSSVNRRYNIKAITDIEKENGWEFTGEQLNAIELALKNNVTIITGGAGTGKSSAIAGVLKATMNATFAQCALSGRAAARLTEVTGATGQTIHRLLSFQHGCFIYDEDNPLPYDIIILDEVSMVGAEIFCALLRAIKSGTKLIMLRDDGQLESIGLCNVFFDMLKSETIPVARLTKIHRQAARSAIITESVKVRNNTQLFPAGWVGQETRGELQDLELDIYSNSILSQDNILDNYRKLLAKGISPHSIQVVVPMRSRGDISSLVLNKLLQTIVNPNKNGVAFSITVNKSKHSYTISCGDRVIVTKNTYDSVKYRVLGDEKQEPCPVFNRDRGIVVEIDANHMVVDFDLWGEVYLDKKQMRTVELGYALTCHKLQGSEAPYVIVGMDSSGHVLTTKEWLYTAITRAKKKCILCAQSKAISYAISRSNISTKKTMLADLLQEKKGDTLVV